jgi:hypothetical protein
MSVATRRIGGAAFVLLASLLAAESARHGFAAPRAPVLPARQQPRSNDLERMADEVAREVEQLRGWTFKRPVKKERISAARARQDIRRMLLLADKPDHRQRQQAFLRVSGLIPADCDLLLSNLTVLDQQVAGYYETTSHTLRLVDRPNPMPPFVERMVLAHELTHALDDQYIDLSDLMAPGAGTEDMTFVATALGEGSATALMLQQMSNAQRSGRFSLTDLSQYVAEELERAKTLDQLPRYFSAMFSSYIVGAAFLAKGSLASLLELPDNRSVGENLLVARRFLPRSSEQMLHPNKYWAPGRDDEPVVFDDKAIDRWLARPERRIIYRDTLGELLTALLTEPRDGARSLAGLQSPSAWTNQGAAGWGGDRFFLLSDRPAPDTLKTMAGLRGVWLTAWDTPRDREEFLASLEKGTPAPNSVAVRVERQLAVVFIGVGDAERGSLMRRLSVASLRMTKGNHPWSQ